MFNRANTYSAELMLVCRSTISLTKKDGMGSVLSKLKNLINNPVKLVETGKFVSSNVFVSKYLNVTPWKLF